MGQEISTGTNMTVANRDLKMVKKIAEGGYSFVYLVEDVRNGQPFAIKRCIASDSHASDLVLKEINILKKLAEFKSPQIVGYYGSVCRPSQGAKEYYILMEYCSHGSLINQLQTFMDRGQKTPEQTILTVVEAALKGLKVLHDQSPPIAHRDIKIENILIATDGSYKLCDFGSITDKSGLYTTTSEIMTQQDIIAKHSTEMYRAPEMCDLYRAKQNKWPINEKVDIWAMGSVIYTLAHFTHPFEEGGAMSILSGRLNVPKCAYSPYVHYIMSKCFTVDPTVRPSVDQLLAICDSWRVFLQTKGQRHGSQAIADELVGFVPGIISATKAPTPAPKPVPRAVPSKPATVQPLVSRCRGPSVDRQDTFEVEWSDDESTSTTPQPQQPQPQPQAIRRATSDKPAQPTQQARVGPRRGVHRTTSEVATLNDFTAMSLSLQSSNALPAPKTTTPVADILDWSSFGGTDISANNTPIAPTHNDDDWGSEADFDAFTSGNVPSVHSDTRSVGSAKSTTSTSTHGIPPALVAPPLSRQGSRRTPFKADTLKRLDSTDAAFPQPSLSGVSFSAHTQHEGASQRLAAKRGQFASVDAATLFAAQRQQQQQHVKPTVTDDLDMFFAPASTNKAPKQSLMTGDSSDLSDFFHSSSAPARYNSDSNSNNNSSNSNSKKPSLFDQLHIAGGGKVHNNHTQPDFLSGGF